jgi:large subunit ribosomal protein L30e
MDMHKSLRLVVQTGKVHYGLRQARRDVKDKKAKVVVVPQNVREDVLKELKGASAPLVKFEGSSFDLGAVCGKPFSVGALTVLDVGDSDIMDAVPA